MLERRGALPAGKWPIIRRNARGSYLKYSPYRLEQRSHLLVSIVSREEGMPNIPNVTLNALLTAVRRATTRDEREEVKEADQIAIITELEMIFLRLGPFSSAIDLSTTFVRRFHYNVYLASRRLGLGLGISGIESVERNVKSISLAIE